MIRGYRWTKESVDTWYYRDARRVIVGTVCPTYSGPGWFWSAFPLGASRMDAYRNGHTGGPRAAKDCVEAAIRELVRA